ncbi:MAG: UMP kinase [Candidatus Thermoplasmatota archaeon]|nr:UMP kinase [Candidatus Thermoplasmatota archaeon]
MEKIAISIGGSILVPDNEDTSYIKQLASALLDMLPSYKFLVVCGGGKIARYYITIGRALGADESSLDELGIEVTRLNARLLITALGEKAYYKPAESIDEARLASNNYPIVVMGGTHPGQTTDAVAALAAEKIKAARIINATSVDGVYTDDPRTNPAAKRIDRMTFKELMDKVVYAKMEAGSSFIFDPLGAKLISRSRIPTAVVFGRDIQQLVNAVRGQPFVGTMISSPPPAPASDAKESR